MHTKYVAPNEIAQKIDKNINPNKASGINENSPRVLKELSYKGNIVILGVRTALF